MQWFGIQKRQLLHYEKKETNPPRRNNFQPKNSQGGPKHSSVETQGKSASSEKQPFNNISKA